MIKVSLRGTIREASGRTSHLAVHTIAGVYRSSAPPKGGAERLWVVHVCRGGGACPSVWRIWRCAGLPRQRLGHPGTQSEGGAVAHHKGTQRSRAGASRSLCCTHCSCIVHCRGLLLSCWGRLSACAAAFRCASWALAHELCALAKYSCRQPQKLHPLQLHHPT